MSVTSLVTKSFSAELRALPPTRDDAIEGADFGVQPRWSSDATSKRAFDLRP